MKDVARRVKVRAQALRYDVFIVSIIISFEKKPDRKGMPVRARLPTVREEEVKGRSLCMEPILRISCSSLRL